MNDLKLSFVFLFDLKIFFSTYLHSFMCFELQPWSMADADAVQVVVDEELSSDEYVTSYFI